MADYIESADLIALTATFHDGAVRPITKLIDKNGAITTAPENAVIAIIKVEANDWRTLDLRRGERLQ